MFDLIEDKTKPEIKWWTVPSAAFLILLVGVNFGILIGRRDVDPYDWVQAIFLFFVALVILRVVARELKLLREQEKNSHVH